MIYCILYFTRQKGIRLRQLARPLSIVERLFRRTAHCIMYIVHSQFSHLSETAVCTANFFYNCFQIATIWILRNVSR